MEDEYSVIEKTFVVKGKQKWRWSKYEIQEIVELIYFLA